MNFAIIAAGQGSRLAQEGVKEPKPLVRVGDEVLIGRLLRIFCNNGATQIHVICNDQMQDVQQYLAEAGKRLQSHNITLHVIVKSTPSSMHSFYELRKQLPEQEKFILTTVDTIFNEKEFSEYVAAFAADNDADGMMGLTQYIDDEKPLYVGLNNAGDRISGYYDTENSCNHISAGIYGLTAKAFATLDKCIDQGQSRMRNFQRALLTDGLTLKPFVFGTVFDIDHADDIRKAEALCKKQRII